MSRDILKKFAARVGYSPADLEHFKEGDPRLRQVEKAKVEVQVGGRKLEADG